MDVNVRAGRGPVSPADAEPTIVNQIELLEGKLHELRHMILNFEELRSGAAQAATNLRGAIPEPIRTVAMVNSGSQADQNGRETPRPVLTRLINLNVMTSDLHGFVSDAYNGIHEQITRIRETL